MTYISDLEDQNEELKKLLAISESALEDVNEELNCYKKKEEFNHTPLGEKMHNIIDWVREFIVQIIIGGVLISFFGSGIIIAIVEAHEKKGFLASKVQLLNYCDKNAVKFKSELDGLYGSMGYVTYEDKLYDTTGSEVSIKDLNKVLKEFVHKKLKEKQ